MPSPLAPSKSISRLLISTPSQFTGEYADDAVMISHAWDTENAHYSLGRAEGPYNRRYFVVALAHDPDEKKSIVITTRPDAEYTGEVVCIALSVLFGKCFEMHGALQAGGIYYRPSFGVSKPLANFKAPPFNYKPRADLEIPLKLDQFGKVLPLIVKYGEDDPIATTFFAAARFYHRFMLGVDTEPEVAFLDLITALEILSNGMSFTDEELFDPATLGELEAIKGAHGEKLAKKIKERMFQVKRKFVLATHRLLDTGFFAVTEAVAEEHEGRFSLEPTTSPMYKGGKTEITFLRRIKAAYDLRSRYVHVGAKFGAAVAHKGEVNIGRVRLRDEEVGDLAYISPTVYGMERIVRYCLLRFVHLRGTPIDSRLDRPGLPDPPFSA